MTIDPRDALLALAMLSLDRDLTRHRHGARHLPEPHCQIGQMYSQGYRPCSKRCSQKRALVALIGRHLSGELAAVDTTPRQLELIA